MRALAFLVFLLVSVSTSQAHELRPAFLNLTEDTAEHFHVLWKVPALGDRRLSLSVRLPENCANEAAPLAISEDNYVTSRWSVTCAGGLVGHIVVIDGLRTTVTDVLVRVEYASGKKDVVRLTPERVSFEPSGNQVWKETAVTYFRLGVEHILTGIDHLLFILALLLLISNRLTLLKTITAFTVAHSITLSGAALGYLSLPQKPVEAVIALSIAFVASELIQLKPGEKRLSEQFPWLVAFTFGLLHGFGFAGALKEVGLPQVDIPLALVTFNLGVEAGQLLFVAAVLIFWSILQTFILRPKAWARMAAAYGIGTIAAYWLLERLSAFLA
jgi:hydrogenase/urease accessory protein HupE